MFEENPTFKPPDDKNQKIWKYMDFTKFIDLLYTRSLWFARADVLEDKFEGSLPLASVEGMKRSLIAIFKDLEENHKEAMGPVDKEDPFMLKRFIKLQQSLKPGIVINCWHMNEYESAAMWKLYLKSNEGIAIQSTFERLKESLSSTNISINIGKVDYIDHQRDETEIGNALTPYVYKGKSFEHERELRAVIWSIGHGNQGKCKIENGGIKIIIDIEKLIEKVYLAPNSPLWLTNLVSGIINKFGLNVEVTNSGLNGTPLY